MALSVAAPNDKKGKDKGAGYYSPVNNEESISMSQKDIDITSKWDSKMFDVKSVTPKESTFKLSEYFFEHIDRRTKLLVIPAFGMVAIGSLIIIIIGFLGVLNQIVAILVVIGLTWLGAYVGMFGVYRWGAVEDCTEFFKQKNNEYDDELHNLSQIKDEVKKNAKAIHFSVGKLKTHGEELEKNVHEFDLLRQELEKVCDKNNDLQSMLDEINKQYDDWQELIYENEKAHLTSIYFETSLRDGQLGLTQKEYKKFLGRLNKKTRDEFEIQGGFEAMDRDGNGTVDLMEFQHMLDMVWESINEDELKFIRQRSTL